jgi:hypothetical protein
VVVVVVAVAEEEEGLAWLAMYQSIECNRCSNISMCHKRNKCNNQSCTRQLLQRCVIKHALFHIASATTRFLIFWRD